MNLKDVWATIRIQETEKFTGHAKLGIEKGVITSCQRIFFPDLDKIKKEPLDSSTLEKNLNTIRQIDFGNLEFDFFEGRPTNMSALEFKNCKEFTEMVEGFKCKYVRRVVLKSNT